MIRRILPPLAILAVLFGCAALPAPAPTGTVRVRLMRLERAVPGATATALADPGSTFSERRIVATAGADGWAALALPPGSWFLEASSPSPALFGWYGVNPVHVRPGETLEIAIPALPAPPPPRGGAGRAGGRGGLRPRRR